MVLVRSVLLAVLLCCGGGLLAEDPRATDGIWHPVTAVLGGQEMPKAVRDGIVLKLDGDDYTVTVNGAPDKGTCAVDRSVTPHRMTIQGTVGPNQGKTLLAICEVTSEGLLRVCYDLSGSAFPTEFKSDTGTSSYLVEYRQELPRGTEITGTVVEVPDSDVVRLKMTDEKTHSIRLNGIDAPELKQDFGETAQAELVRLVQGRTIRVVTQSEDRIGQIIGDVYVKEDGTTTETFVNVFLVAKGFAWHFVRFAPENRLLADSEAAARKSRTGLWNAEHPTAPWDWRKQQAESSKKSSGK